MIHGMGDGVLGLDKIIYNGSTFGGELDCAGSCGRLWDRMAIINN